MREFRRTNNAKSAAFFSKERRFSREKTLHHAFANERERERGKDMWISIPSRPSYKLQIWNSNSPSKRDAQEKKTASPFTDKRRTSTLLVVAPSEKQINKDPGKVYFFWEKSFSGFRFWTGFLRHFSGWTLGCYKNIHIPKWTGKTTRKSFAIHGHI